VHRRQACEIDERAQIAALPEPSKDTNAGGAPCVAALSRVGERRRDTTTESPGRDIRTVFQPYPLRQERHIDDAPEVVELSVIGVMFSDTAANGDARPTPALLTDAVSGGAAHAGSFSSLPPPHDDAADASGPATRLRPEPEEPRSE
jgi:hypothetical protein